MTRQFSQSVGGCLGTQLLLNNVFMQSVFDRQTFTFNNWVLLLSQIVLFVQTMQKKFWVRRNCFVLTLGARPVPDKIHPEKEQF